MTANKTATATKKKKKNERKKTIIKKHRQLYSVLRLS